MNKIKKSTLLLLLASSLLLSGCEVISAQEYEDLQTEKINYNISNEIKASESTDKHGENVAESKESKYRKEYDEEGNLYLINNKTEEIIPPFPEGWSGERISKMVTIDGYQFTLPCKVSDILALSEDFRADESFDYGDGTSSFQIWYEDVIAVTGIYNNDTEIIEMIDIRANDYTDFEKFDSTAPQDIVDNIFKNIPNNEMNFINVSYIENDLIYHIVYTYTNEKNSTLCFLWEEL